MSPQPKPNQLFLIVEMRDGAGRVHAKVALELPESAAYIGDRAVDEIRAGVYYDPTEPKPMMAVGKVLQVRELRKDLFVREATRAGHLLSDFLCDREGWNGPDRAEHAADALKAWR